MRFATSAAKVSLSPNLISSVATVSFSLITGTVPSFNKFSRVAEIFSKCLAFVKLSWVKSTCAVWTLCLANKYS